MKIKVIRRRIILELLITFGVCAIFSGMLWFFSDLVDGIHEEKNKYSGQVAGLDNQIQDMTSKLNRFQGDHSNYRKLFTEEGLNELKLNREDIKDIFNEQQTKHALDRLQISIDPLTDMKEEQFKRPRAQAIMSVGNLTFLSFNDEETLRFLADLQQKLPGFIKITQFSMKRAPGKEATGANVVTSTMPELANDIRFQWLGLKDPAPPTDDKNKISPPGGKK